ncbi:MAG: hypothetical protein ACRD1K_20015 [Acidimicrobiales bacterium]
MDGFLLLFYSGNEWTGPDYATGVARCASPTGPCVKQESPVLSSVDGLSGPGGLSVTEAGDGEFGVAFHSWSPVAGYERGGHRQLRVEVWDADRLSRVVGEISGRG